MLTITPQSRAITEYYRELEAIHAQGVRYEQATRAPFEHLLTAFAKPVADWTLLLEQPLANGKRPDGTLRDSFNLPRGYWEAKDTSDDLETEIRKKIAVGYPTINTIFEDTRRAVLFQAGRRADEFDLTKPQDVADLLRAFFTYAEPEIERFDTAVAEFKERIPELAEGLKQRIKAEHAAHNPTFADAWASFFSLCKTSLDPNIRSETVDEMLVQHLLTERLFRTVFNNPDFTQRNAIAAEIEKVIVALTSRAFNRAEFLRSLDRFYKAIEDAAKDLHDWQQKQAFMNVVYERFFQGYSVKDADTHGIVYTPQEIVDFMCASVEEALRNEFGRSLSDPGVQILDPATGTGSFVVNLLRRISGVSRKHKYQHDLFANEIMLLPYYIASLNIEHAYYELSGEREYLPFEGICFVDTLELAERVAHHGLGERPLWVTERNTERVEAEKEAQIMVVIGNPPYNVGQENENDNNKNRKYDVIDARIHDTYAKDSRATNKNKLSDAYVKFFRWATDRLQGRDGIVCLVSNNSFLDQISFDGMRRHLLQDFTRIYHLDLHGNVRKNPKLSGTKHNVFGIQVGVGITIAIRSSAHKDHTLYYYRVPEDWRREEKTGFLERVGSIANVDWQPLKPDDQYNFLTEGLQPEFEGFLPMGSKGARTAQTSDVQVIFKLYSVGVNTARDQIAYNFNRQSLAQRVEQFIEDYNAEVSRWIRAGCPKPIDEFVHYDRVKWSESLKLNLGRRVAGQYDQVKIRVATYRPFCKRWLFFDRLINERVYQLPQIYPTPSAEAENRMICAANPGADYQSFLQIQGLADIKCGISGNSIIQCFPLYTYDEDGSNRRENVTDWALARFREAYGDGVSKRDIFDYVYAVLHHPVYRERYAENLKRELPRIPLVAERESFDTCVRIGRELARLHVEYDEVRAVQRTAVQAVGGGTYGVAEWPLRMVETGPGPDWRVKKMRLTPDKTALIYNDWLTLDGIPPEVFQYRLGNRSALEWVIDQYQASTDHRSGITSDPNRADDEEYIVRLVKRVVTVSVETVRLVAELARAVEVVPPAVVRSTLGEP